MFVREGGAEDNPQRTIKEQNVFSVLKQMGFSSDLYAMQSEMWFYSNTMADNIAYREQIGAEPRNRGKNVDDMLLIDELHHSLDTTSRASISLSCIPKVRTSTIPSVIRVASHSGRRSV
jgi:KDO II ethanolaminephosphotransferase